MILSIPCLFLAVVLLGATLCRRKYPTGDTCNNQALWIPRRAFRAFFESIPRLRFSILASNSAGPGSSAFWTLAGKSQEALCRDPATYESQAQTWKPYVDSHPFNDLRKNSSRVLETLIFPFFFAQFVQINFICWGGVLGFFFNLFEDMPGWLQLLLYEMYLLSVLTPPPHLIKKLKWVNKLFYRLF